MPWAPGWRALKHVSVSASGMSVSALKDCLFLPQGYNWFQIQHELSKPAYCVPPLVVVAERYRWTKPHECKPLGCVVFLWMEEEERGDLQKGLGIENHKILHSRLWPFVCFPPKQWDFWDILSSHRRYREKHVIGCEAANILGGWRPYSTCCYRGLLCITSLSSTPTPTLAAQTSRVCNQLPVLSQRESGSELWPAESGWEAWET